jgi:hypothetical protein
MKNKLVSHSFYKIVEGKSEPALAEIAVIATIKLVDEVADKIRAAEGSEAVENVLNYREVKRALEQCLDHLTNNNSQVSSVDYSIYYDFLSNKLAQAEKVIDEELSFLNL